MKSSVPDLTGVPLGDVVTLGGPVVARLLGAPDAVPVAAFTSAI